MKTIEDLVPKLIDQTRDGRITWGVTASSGHFHTQVGKFFVEVWNWEDEDGLTGISIGLKADGLNQPLIDSMIVDSYSAKYARLSDLHAMARRSALNIEAVINEIDQFLDFN